MDKIMRKAKQQKRNCICGILLAAICLAASGCANDEAKIVGLKGERQLLSIANMLERMAKIKYFDTENLEKRYFDEDNITNLKEALGGFEVPWDISREIMVESYSENFPMELQEILVQNNDNIRAENDDWLKYGVSCWNITPETAGEIPYDDIVEAAEAGSHPDSAPIGAVDIDGDGTDEYVVTGFMGRGNCGIMSVVKNVEGEWTLIGGGTSGDSTVRYSVLEYDGRYYLLLGDELSRWDDEAGIPNREYWERNDAMPEQADCWNALTVQKDVVDYTPCETYRFLQEDDTDYLAGVDLTSLAGSSGEKHKISALMRPWLGGEYRTFALEYSWKQECEGKEYLYITADIDGKQGDFDRVLIILREIEGEQKEIVKVYYLLANYNMRLEER